MHNTMQKVLFLHKMVQNGSWFSIKKIVYACVFLVSFNASAFDHYSVEIIKEHFVITIDKCSYRERLKRSRNQYETKDIIRRALQACRKV